MSLFHTYVQFMKQRRERVCIEESLQKGESQEKRKLLFLIVIGDIILKGSYQPIELTHNVVGVAAAGAVAAPAAGSCIDSEVDVVAVIVDDGFDVIIFFVLGFAKKRALISPSRDFEPWMNRLISVLNEDLYDLDDMQIERVDFVLVDVWKANEASAVSLKCPESLPRQHEFRSGECGLTDGVCCDHVSYYHCIESCPFSSMGETVELQSLDQ